jgi:tetratricopeptide (TPR) repeat protein
MGTTLGLAGVVGRIGMRALDGGRPELAVDLTRHAVALAGNERERTVATIRLGEALRGAKQLDEAEQLLRTALELDPDYRDFALQHLGKTPTDAGRFAEAQSCLGEALAMRQAKGDAGLVASTEAALAAIPPSAGSSSASSASQEPC